MNIRETSSCNVPEYRTWSISKARKSSENSKQDLDATPVVIYILKCNPYRAILFHLNGVISGVADHPVFPEDRIWWQ
jgi:hypothetical protein